MEKRTEWVKITSRKNSEIREAAEIAASPQKRESAGLFLAEGARLCEDAALSGTIIEKLFVTAAARRKYAQYLEPVCRAAANAYEIEDHVAELLSQTKHSQGVFCLCRKPAKQEVFFAGKWAALENIQDPANLGAVMRTAEALGVNGLVLIGGCDAFSPKAVRASMGAVFRMQIAVYSTVAALAEAEKIKNTVCFAAVPDISAEKLGKFIFPADAMLFIGNEGNGLSQQAIDFCKRKITIPMQGRAESLNAAAAAAICLWEMVKP